MPHRRRFGKRVASIIGERYLENMRQVPEVVRRQGKAGPCTTERMPTARAPGMSVQFPVSREILARIPGSVPNFSAVSRLMRTREIQNGEGT
jgi:hypothetical protein